MTHTLVTLLQSLVKDKMDVRETMSVLTRNRSIYWSWGTSSVSNVNDRGLLLKVNGFHHKSYVFITLDYNDTYTVHISSNRGTILDTYEMVYVDMLVEVIDNRIEKIPDYKF